MNYQYDHSSNTQPHPLDDIKVSGVIFTGGMLTGMENLARWGNAVPDTKLELNNLREVDFPIYLLP